MKSMDVLIVEQGTVAPSWDDAEIVKRAFIDTVENNKKEGTIRDHPFNFQDPEKLPGCTLPWTDLMNKMNPGVALHIEKIFKPILENIPLQNVHPVLILFTIKNSLEMKSRKFFGMDYTPYQ